MCGAPSGSRPYSRHTLLPIREGDSITMNTQPTELRSNDAHDDSGFGLVEIVVSMLILAALALAFLPLLITGLKTSAASSTLATATQLVNEKMQLAQSKGPVCADVAAIAGSADLTDPRGVVLRVTTTAGACTGSPKTVSVTTSVVRIDSGATVATASTLVYVGS